MPKHKEKKPQHEPCEHCSCSDAEPAPIDDYSPEGYEALLAERDDFCARYQRALADYQNAQRRFSADMAAARESGVERVLASLIPVLDHFDLALAQDTAKVGADQIVAGVRMIRDEFNRAVAALGVAPINPAPNDEFDPAQHQALSQLPAEGVEPGRVSSVFQIGYRVSDRVVRAAKVTIAPPPKDERETQPRTQDAPAGEDA